MTTIAKIHAEPAILFTFHFFQLPFGKERIAFTAMLKNARYEQKNYISQSIFTV